MANFSIDYKTVMNCLPLDISIKNVFTGDSKTFTAIFDTGATNTVVSKRVFDLLKLQKSGDITLINADGSSVSILTKVDIELSSDILFKYLEVSVSTLPAGVDALLGMDIITRGNFHVNTAASTVLSFYTNV